MYGTLINAGAIIAGSVVGLLFHTRLPKRIVKIIFQGIGLFTLFIGFSMAAKTNNFLIMIFSIILGAVAGELIDIEKYVNQLGKSIKKGIKNDNESFSEGLTTAFLMYCMGSMTILGAFEEGMGEAPNLLLAKSVLDGVSSIALTSAFGIGVMFSVVPLLLYQGSLTLTAGLLHDIVSEPLMNEMTAVGGLLLIGLGVNILEIKKIKVLNMIPALAFAVVLAYLFLL